jgi:hypothetical protein
MKFEIEVKELDPPEDHFVAGAWWSFRFRWKVYDDQGERVGVGYAQHSWAARRAARRACKAHVRQLRVRAKKPERTTYEVK